MPRLWLLLALAIAACNNTPHKPPDPGSASGSAMPHVQHLEPPGYEARMQMPAIEVPKQELFRVLDPGKGAKTVLRYTLAGEHEQHLETTLAERTLVANKVGDPVQLPAIRDGFAVTFAKDAVALRPLPVTLAGTPTPAAEQYIAPWKTQLQGRRLDVVFDARGQFGAITFRDDPMNQRVPHAKDELVQRLLATTVPLPEPAVGTGASWQVITVLRQGPAYIKQTATYTLVEKAARWKLKVKLLRIGEEQTLFDPALPRGTSIELIMIFRVLEGTVEIDPKSPFIAAGKLSIESRVHAKVAAPGKPPAEQYVEDLGAVTFTAEAKP
jgi:hypothetical protein